jgi:hypothetical protein
MTPGRTLSDGRTVWLVTWEWAGDHAEPEERVAAILNRRVPAERVREIVELLYANEYLSLSERAAVALNPKKRPYPARFGSASGLVWDGEILCGHNPWLRARQVRLQTDVPGEVTWEELPRPDALPDGV